ncbi:hypothetical protein TH468_13140 [Thalassospira sp. MCCC 1A03138]|nr:hypothetical protein TH468_13140 [Thalassospira sp. MCCC 1A03138]
MLSTPDGSFISDRVVSMQTSASRFEIPHRTTHPQHIIIEQNIANFGYLITEKRLNFPKPDHPPLKKQTTNPIKLMLIFITLRRKPETLKLDFQQDNSHFAPSAP